MEKSEEPAFNAPPVTKYLVATLIGVHILLLVTEPATRDWFYANLSFDIATSTAILQTPTGGGIAALFFTATSHMFLHDDFMHLLINAFMLLAFGAMVERHFGVATFISLFLLCGWAGAFSEYFVSYDAGGGYLYGASGAVFGMMGATMRLMFPKYGLQKVVAFAAVMMGVNLVIGLSPLGQMLTGGDATISWAAHLGGFVAGGALSLLFRPDPV
ncbi:hypothetical protein A9Q83_14275 [Alphaproteobacteria bacterium 46_93_T64]|nr:hypothetical protein A9Q83_14275 [Alphaproteobacteria bacterium 46_93_T64]